MIIKLLAFILFKTTLSTHAHLGSKAIDVDTNMQFINEDPEDFLSRIGY